MSATIRHRVAQTAGHSWDGGLQVYNNPIPRPWLWLLLAAGALALTYWLLYPSWPVPGGHYQGLLEVELNRDDERRVVRWSTAAEIEAMSEVQQARRQRLGSEIMRSESFALLADARMREHALAIARATYMDQCSACHAVDGRGIDGLGADLIDGSWRADAGFRAIERQVSDFNQQRHGGRVGSQSAQQAAAVGTGASGSDAGSLLAKSGSRGLSPLTIKALTVYVQQLAQ